MAPLKKVGYVHELGGDVFGVVLGVLKGRKGEEEHIRNSAKTWFAVDVGIFGGNGYLVIFR